MCLHGIAIASGLAMVLRSHVVILRGALKDRSAVHALDDVTLTRLKYDIGFYEWDSSVKSARASGRYVLIIIMRGHSGIII